MRAEVTDGLQGFDISRRSYAHTRAHAHSLKETQGVSRKGKQISLPRRLGSWEERGGGEVHPTQTRIHTQSTGPAMKIEMGSIVVREVSFEALGRQCAVHASTAEGAAEQARKG